MFADQGQARRRARIANGVLLAYGMITVLLLATGRAQTPSGVGDFPVLFWWLVGGAGLYGALTAWALRRP